MAWILTLSYLRGFGIWVVVAIAAYVYGIRDSSALAPFIAAIIVALLANLTVQLRSELEDKAAKFKGKIGLKGIFLNSVAGMEIPFIILALALLASRQHDWRLVVGVIITFQAVLAALFYFIWSKMKEAKTRGL